jgi:hypothetical protein
MLRESVLLKAHINAVATNTPRFGNFFESFEP